MLRCAQYGGIMIPPKPSSDSRLIVISYVRKDKKDHVWLCKCSCGNTVELLAYRVRKEVKSCGCLRSETKTHGNAHRADKSVEYVAWLNAKYLVSQSGGKLTMCPEWDTSFETFLKDMGVKPDSRYHLLRKDLRFGYTPTNTVWGIRHGQEVYHRLRGPSGLPDRR